MAGFAADSIAVVTKGLIRSTGSFSERMVSAGYIGNILAAPSAIAAIARRIVMSSWSIIKRALRQSHKGV